MAGKKSLLKDGAVVKGSVEEPSIDREGSLKLNTKDAVEVKGPVAEKVDINKVKDSKIKE